MTAPNDQAPEFAPLAPVCILCGTDAGNFPLYPGILRCPTCGYVFSDANASSEKIHRMRVSDYFFGEEYSNYIEDKPALQKNFAARIRTLKQYSSGGNLFEIGCAYGFFLELAQQVWNAEGCDITESGCTYARSLGLNAVSAEFLNLPLRHAHYDVVALWDTIEHLGRPDLYIRKASEIVKPGGIICLTTGDLGSTVASFRKDQWRLIQTPTHLHFFDRRSMERLLGSNGFEIIHFEHCGYSRSVQQILYSLLVLHNETPLRKKVYELLKPLFAFSMYLNLYDIMFVIARRKQ